MAGSSVTSTLDIVLRDDVSRTALNVEASLAKMEARAKEVDAALSRSGAGDKFQADLRKIGAQVPHIEAAAKAFQQLAVSENLAADRSEWTKEQAAAVRRWESVTVAGIRNVMSAERALAESEARSSAAFVAAENRRVSAAEHAATSIAHAHKTAGGHFDQSTLGGATAAGAAYAFERMMEGVVERYRDFDKERRYGRAVMGLTDEQQEPLVQQALKGGATSRFNDIQWLEAQREFAARGYKIDQVMAFTPIAADLGTALDKSLPEAVKLLEGAMLGFGKDTSTFEKAVAAARRTADVEVKASKISGMTAEDIEAAYKYGAAPARMAHLSEESLMMFAAISKKANMGGDESGVAFRALAKNLITPTAGAQIAMQAAGIDFNKYQVAPKALNAGGFYDTIAKNFGVALNDRAKASLGAIFSNEKLLGNATQFMPAVVTALKGALGKQDAKSLKSIVNVAKQYRDASVGGIDTNGLLAVLMQAIAKNPSLANAVFGSKQGGRIFAALGDPEFSAKILEALQHHADGYAADIARQRNEGFNGQMAQFQGAIATLESSIGRAFDGGGKGGLATEVASAAARFTAALSELNPAALRAGVEAAAAAAVLAGLKSIDFIKGGFGLKAAGAEMTSAGELQLQAGRLMLEAAATRSLPHGEASPGGAGGKPGEVGAKPGEVPPEDRTGIYDKPPPAEVPKGGKFFAGGGIKGLASGLAEGVIAGIIYSAGEEAIHWFEDSVLHCTAKDRDRIANMHPGKDLDDQLGTMFGRVTDKTSGPDPYLNGERAGFDERARRSAEDFRRQPEATRGQRMMDAFGPDPEMAPFYQDPEAARGRAMMQNFGPAPTVDTSALKAAAAEADQTGEHIRTALSVTAEPRIDTSAIDAAREKVAALKAELASISGSLNFNVTGSGAAGGTSPAKFSPRSAHHQVVTDRLSI